MIKKATDEIAMPNAVRTYIDMFRPEQREIPAQKLQPMPENEEIHGPLLFDDRYHLLTESYKQFGQNKPLIVYRAEEDSYWIIDGVRGWHAGKAAGFTHLSCLVLEVEKPRPFEIMQILNSGGRPVTYKMKAKKLELLEKHAKQYLLETGADENEATELTVRQYKAIILQMSERYVTEFKAVCSHPEKEFLLDQMDKGMSLNKASAIARNKKVPMPKPKGNIPLGRKQIITCEDCPRKKEFQDMIEKYDDINSEVAGSEVDNG